MRPDPPGHTPTNARDVFLDALEVAPESRAAFATAACGGDAAMLAEVGELLREHEGTGGFLEAPALDETTLRSAGALAVIGRPGDRIGRYKLLQQIGEGGCGVVYMAEQEEPVRRRVALKIIKPGMDTRGVIARFEAERQALAMMEHPNIARVLDAGATETGRPFFVMELVRGVRITAYCQENALSTEERLKLFVQVCLAIQHAHQKGVIHRDIKPSNILVTLHDGVPVPKVIDFGIAKATEQRLTDRTLFTEFHSFLGTPAYMSPEQAEMSGLDVDTRSDIYALGVLLYEMLTGTTPFDAGELMKLGIDECRRAIREVEPLRPSTRLTQELTRSARAGADSASPRGPKEARALEHLITQVRGDLDWIVMKCLEKDRARRYATANDLAADVQRFIEGDPVLARPPSNLYRLGKLVRRHRVVVGAAAAVAVTLIAATAVGVWQAVRATTLEKREARLRQQAETETRRAESQTAIARLNEYVADINLAQQSLAAGNHGRALRLLQKHRPVAGEQELRGFEWRYLWQLTRGDEHATFGHPGETAQCVAISPDGQFVVCGAERRVSVWSVGTHTLVATQNWGANAVAFLPGGKSAVLAGVGSMRGSGVTRVVDTTTWTEQRALPGGSAMALSHDGRRLATSGREGIRVWDTATWQQTQFLREAGSPFALSPDGTRLAAHARAGFAVWDIASGEEKQSLENSTNLFVRVGPSRRDRAISFSPDGKWIVIARNMASEAGVFVAGVWDAETGAEAGAMPGDPEHIEHTGAIAALAFSPDGRTLATASLDHSIRLWDFEKRQRVGVLQGHLNEAWAVAFAPDGKSVVSAGKDGGVKLWSTQEPAQDELMTGARLPIAFSRDGRTLAALTRAGSVVFFDAAGGKTVREFAWEGGGGGGGPGRWFNFTAAAVSADLATLVMAGPDGSVQIWNTTTHESSRLRVADGPVGVVALAPDGQTLVTGGWGRSLLCWDMARRTNVMLEVEGERVVFSGDGRYFAVIERGTNLMIFDTVKRRMKVDLAMEAAPVFTSSGSAANFSPDGNLFAVACLDDTIRIWKVEDGRAAGLLTGHKQSVFSVAFAPDGRTLASASDDSTLKFWNVASQQELLTVRRLGGGLRALTFSPDGRMLVAGSSSTLPGGGLRAFRAPPLAEIDLAERPAEAGR
jgi:WD40 repeat protein/serine/threonine protein kinase